MKTDLPSRKHLIHENHEHLLYKVEREDQSLLLKVLKSEYPSVHAIARFKHEYEFCKDLLHVEGVRHVLAYEHADNQHRLLMNYVEGKTLKDLSSQQPFNLVLFLRIAIKLAEVLHHVHQHNIVHKDIKPDNILISPHFDKVVLIDFGIATRLTLKQQHLESPDRCEGTLAYISPEQTGRVNRVVDHRSDLYSLGITFYELLSGALPFDSHDSMEMVHSHLARMARPLHELNASIPAMLSAIVAKLIAKNADERYQSALGLKADLERCLSELEETGRITRFKPGENDFSGRFHIPQKLYGREMQVEVLMQAFDRISRGAIELMLISGYSGVGKSALVSEIHKPITEKRGYFLTGKYDQFQRNVPYYALKQAFTEFCTYILTESAEQVQAWKEAILDAAGNNGQVLIDLVPALEMIIGKQPPVPQLGTQESQNRFNLVFQKFIQVIAQESHPIVLFIDDWQWADAASLGLLRTMMEDKSNCHFLVIGAYRDNEVNEVHPFIRTVRDIEKNGATVTNIHLSNLSPADVTHLIADTVRAGEADVATLAALVYEKTQGNAFFVGQFLESLHEEKLLYFDFAKLTWQWETGGIAARKMTDNVVELVMQKINRLSAGTKEALKFAACIGNQFSLRILAIVKGRSQGETFAWLWEAISEGLLVPLDTNYNLINNLGKHSSGHDEIKSSFRFVHDRVQQAAYSMIAEADRQHIHFKISKILLHHIPRGEMEQWLFDIVNHYNYGISLVKEEQEKKFLAELNLRAGVKAKLSGAYDEACRYLSVALSLLPADAWQHDYYLAYQVHLEKADSEHLNTNFEETLRMFNIISAHAINEIDLVKACEIVISLYTNLAQVVTAVDYSVKAMRILGVEVPDDPARTQVLIEENIAFIQSVITSKQSHELFEMPEMRDPLQLALMNIMTKAVPPVYQVNPQLMGYILTMLLKNSLKYGYTASSAYAYSAYCILIGDITKDYELTYRLGKLAMQLNLRFEDMVMKGAIHYVVAHFVIHWTKHISESIDLFREGLKWSIEGGDYVHASWCSLTMSLYVLFRGTPLDTAYEEVMQAYHFLQTRKNPTCLQTVKMFKYYIHGLQGKTQRLGSFDEEDFKEKKFVEVFSKDQYILGHYYVLKLSTLFIAGQYAEALAMLPAAAQCMPVCVGSSLLAEYNFYDSLLHIQAYRKATPQQQATYLQHINDNQQVMKVWAQSSPANYRHKYLLVKAEKARILGKDSKAIELYERSIRSAAKGEFIHNEALACELAAKFYLSKNIRKVAVVYLREAKYLYEIWGAAGKVAAMESEYGTLLMGTRHTHTIHRTGRHHFSTHPGTLSPKENTAGVLLDINTLMKATHTLSEEVNLPKLLEKMIRILTENAGAERTVYISYEEETLLINAEGRIDDEHVQTLQQLSLADHPVLPLSVIQYVVNTHRALVLGDAYEDPTYGFDDYIKHHRVHSVLCQPVLHKGMLRGLIYMENNLSTGVFTSERLELLRMLSSQIAVSIENALLYENLEHKVKERTAELSNKNQRLTDSIRYAKTIQTAILPLESTFERLFDEHLILYRPKDIVSGDFYWTNQIDNVRWIAVVDCTGHGVPGAFMSMIGNSLLSELINEKRISSPAQVLENLNIAIHSGLQQSETENTDGMDVCLCRIETTLNGDIEVTFAGAKRSLMYIHKGKLEEIKGDKHNIGGNFSRQEREFTNHTIRAAKGDILYLMTDGLVDQSNPQRTRYGSSRLKQVLEQNSHLSMQVQKTLLINELECHQQMQEQRDDITVIGIKL